MANKYFSHSKFLTGFLLLIVVLFIYKYLEILMQDKFPIIVDNAEDYVNVAIDAIRSNEMQIVDLKEIIARRNENPVIVNNMLLSSTNAEYLAVIVVQVRRNKVFFESLIQSLKAVKGIKKTLLIFSHEIFDDHMNNIVLNVTFTRYIQIYYPFSIQLHPKRFPGDDPMFCVDDLNCEKNKGRRNSTIVQKKHHWWWTVNFVFNHLKPIESYTGTVVFIGEDQCVAKDFIYILNMFEYTQPTTCPNCMIYSLAVLKPNITLYYQRPAVLTIKSADSTEEMMGIAFNRTVWSELKKSTDNFCTFNDVDWTRSLVYSLNKTPNRFFSILSIDVPRVFRFDTFYCGDQEKVEMMQILLRKIENGLFPKRSVVRPDDTHVTANISQGHGGWGDARDHVLCHYFSRNIRHTSN